MQRRQLIHSVSPVFPIGLGCMNFGGFYGPSSEFQARETLSHAIDLGVEHLDTANIYGLGVCEEILGRFLSPAHHHTRIATKAGIWRDREHGNRGFNNKSDYLREQLEGSLRRLKREHVDLFYIHRRDPDVEIEDVMQTLLELKKEGKIGGIGFSEISPSSLRRAATVGTVDAVQSEYSLWSRLPELGLLQTCRELGVGFVAYCPLGRGMLTDYIPDPTAFAEKDFRKNNPRFQEPNLSFNLARVTQFRAYAADHGASTAAMAIAWCLAQNDNIIAIPGTRSARHLEECMEGARIALTEEMKVEIEHILPVGWAHGDRYSKSQWNGPEGYC
ncbi:aldo/keto reductase [Lutimaribacter marinistellae]|uniref:Aldo/keto reductase n=1 Tax=Lutimaribacter marinistellae TaxID=1820329 RepID=A0ABV7TKP9_9RHOB